MLADTSPSTEQVSLLNFFRFIYCNEEGYSYIALKVPDSGEWEQHFFKYPQELPQAVGFVLEKRTTHEVYYSPALFTQPIGKKEHVKGARVVWVEQDGTLSSNLSEQPAPSLLVRSSTDDHQHIYWRFDRLITAYDLERINRSLTYILGSDTSGWDANQVLRPIETFNHKRQRKVELVHKSEAFYTTDIFEGLPEPPPVVEAPVPNTIPDIADVIAKHEFQSAVWNLFKKTPVEGERSTQMMQLGYELARMQLNNEEIFAMILNADERWGKFKGRADQYKRLMEIVVRARMKFPLLQGVANETEDSRLVTIGLQELLATEAELEWQLEGLLQKAGYMLVTGPSGVGKTQFSLDAAAQLALGKNFLEHSVNKPQKVGFASLEMGIVDLKFFLQKQVKNYTHEELDALQENLRFIPLGEPIYLNRDEEKRRIEEMVERENLDLIIIDSLGSTTEDELSKEKDVKNLMDWCDHLRKTYGVSVWFIHHHRKATGDNKKPNKLADVYGSQYITARATTVLALWDVGVPNSLQVLPLKLRLAPKPNPFNIYRGPDLRFTLKKEGITVIEEVESPDEFSTEEQETVVEDVPTTGPGFGFNL